MIPEWRLITRVAASYAMRDATLLYILVYTANIHLHFCWPIALRACYRHRNCAVRQLRCKLASDNWIELKCLTCSDHVLAIIICRLSFVCCSSIGQTRGLRHDSVHTCVRMCTHKYIYKIFSILEQLPPKRTFKCRNGIKTHAITNGDLSLLQHSEKNFMKVSSLIHTGTRAAHKGPYYKLIRTIQTLYD